MEPAGPGDTTTDRASVERSIRRGSGVDAVYSEADVADMRERWERISKEREWSQQLSVITGQLQTMPELIRSISREVARTVVADVLKNQQVEGEKRFGIRWERWAVVIQLTLLTAGMIYQIFIRHGP